MTGSQGSNLIKFAAHQVGRHSADDNGSGSCIVCAMQRASDLPRDAVLADSPTNDLAIKVSTPRGWYLITIVLARHWRWYLGALGTGGLLALTASKLAPLLPLIKQLFNW